MAARRPLVLVAGAVQELVSADEVVDLKLTTPDVTNPTITNYVEKVSASTGSTTLDLANGTIFVITTNGSITVTLPAAVQGKSFLVLIKYGGAHTVTFAGGSSIKWAGGTAPDATSVSGKVDLYGFTQDTGVTYARDAGRNY